MVQAHPIHTQELDKVKAKLRSTVDENNKLRAQLETLLAKPGRPREEKPKPRWADTVDRRRAVRTAAADLGADHVVI